MLAMACKAPDKVRRKHSEIPEEYTRFMFVRNPWDRLVSCYENFRRSPTYFRDRCHFGCFRTNDINDLSFDEFARSIRHAPDSKSNEHWMSQHTFLPSFDPPVHFLGRFETLQQDWKLLQQQFDLRDLGHHNPTKHAHYSLYYSPRLKDIVAKRFETDIKMFNYEFEG
jgi:hypothetical protein